jgi:hypothetical protein
MEDGRSHRGRKKQQLFKAAKKSAYRLSVMLGQLPYNAHGLYPNDGGPSGY